MLGTSLGMVSLMVRIFNNLVASMFFSLHTLPAAAGASMTCSTPSYAPVLYPDPHGKSLLVILCFCCVDPCISSSQFMASYRGSYDSDKVLLYSLDTACVLSSVSCYIDFCITST